MYAYKYISRESSSIDAFDGCHCGALTIPLNACMHACVHMYVYTVCMYLCMCVYAIYVCLCSRGVNQRLAYLHDDSATSSLGLRGSVPSRRMVPSEAQCTATTSCTHGDDARELC
jgi:hypothetical protein